MYDLGKLKMIATGFCLTTSWFVGHRTLTTTGGANIALGIRPHTDHTSTKIVSSSRHRGRRLLCSIRFVAFVK